MIRVESRALKSLVAYASSARAEFAWSVWSRILMVPMSECKLSRIENVKYDTENHTIEER